MHSTKKLLQFINEGGAVVRYHTRPGIKPDTDAHHSHGVLMLASIIAGPGLTVALLMACATHDLAEQWASDVSAGSKEVLGLGAPLAAAERMKRGEYGLDWEAELTPEEVVILKLADSLDCLMYCCREAALGNRNARLIWKRTCARLETMTGPDGVELSIDAALRAADVYDALREVWAEVIGPEGPAFDVFSK